MHVIRGLVVCMLALGGTAEVAASTFQSCESGVAERPAEYESYRCYFEVAGRNGEWQSAATHLERLAQTHPKIDWIVFTRALVSTPVDKSAAERLYAEAARRFQTASNIRGEVLARANLQVILYESGRLGSASREVERVAQLGVLSQDPEIRIRARLVEAQFLISTGSNLGHAYRVLKEAETELEQKPTYRLRQHVLHDLGRVLLLTGQHDEAVTYFRRLQEEAVAQQDLSTGARARLDVINTLLEKRAQEPDSVNLQRLFADAEEALAAAQQAQNLDLELDALRMLGEAMMTDRPQEAIRHIETCVSKAEKAERPQSLSHCLSIKARLLAEVDGVAAQQLNAAAIAQLQSDEGADQRLLAYAWRNAMRLAWQIQPPDQAIETGKQTLTTIERLRDLQPGLHGRAAAFSSWTHDYYWLSAQIIRQTRLSESGRENEHIRVYLDHAFQISERMRARSLLDRLRSPSTHLVDRNDATIHERRALLKAISEVNRQLLHANARDRSQLLSKLEALERQELATREATAPKHVAALPVSVPQLQQTLAPNEALLSFQIGPKESVANRPVAGSWLFAITRDDVRVVALPDRHALSQSMSLFTGLMRQPPAQRQRAATALYDQLLADALSRIPAEIERLIIVPDFPVDTLPLSALGHARNPSARFEPVAERFEIVLAPSATIWHDWRTQPLTPRAGSVLVLADPQLDFASKAATPEQSSIHESSRVLGALPHARAEGKRIIEQMRGRGTLWLGHEASEAALKTADLSNRSVLHFAAHTIIDGGDSDRSAIVLASERQQDGFLQNRDIYDLRLDGQLVVLASCQSATGTHVRGEGVLGLARAFFSSGARTVVGSLWPIRDDHARAFFESFYASLAEQRSVGAAFAEAQRELIANNFPAEAWAGFVLMGDADVTPVVGMSSAAKERSNWVVLGVVVGVLLVTGVLVRSRRRMSRSS